MTTSLALDALVAEVDNAINKEAPGGGGAAPAIVASTATPVATDGTSTTVASAASIIPTAMPSVDSTNDDRNKETSPSFVRHTKRKEAFLVALKRYISGEEVDVTPCYLALERVFSQPEIGAMTQEVRNDLMLRLMNCIEGEMLFKSDHVE